MTDKIETGMPATDTAPATRAVAHPSEPDSARRPARLALYFGGALVALGLLVLYLGYDGAATNPLPQAQTPYVISGGLLGVALMVIGAVTIAVHVLLQVEAAFRTELRALRESVETLSEAIAHQTFAPAAASGPGSSRNGVVTVARGQSSFHRPDCRLVLRSGNTKPLPREEAERTGLIACRICKP